MKKMTGQFLCSRMMLPEHKEALYQQRQKIREKENNYVPLFDEQELELWERLFQQSLEQGTEITVTYISDGEKDWFQEQRLSMTFLGERLLLQTEITKFGYQSKKYFPLSKESIYTIP